MAKIKLEKKKKSNRFNNFIEDLFDGFGYKICIGLIALFGLSVISFGLYYAFNAILGIVLILLGSGIIGHYVFKWYESNDK